MYDFKGCLLVENSGYSLFYVLINKLESSDRSEQDYVFSFFSNSIRSLSDKPGSRLKKTIISGLEAGDARFKGIVDNFFWSGEEWREPFTEALDSFEEQSLPYDPNYDEDIPF